MNLATGTMLGPYELLSPLGAGGMGEVYRANDTRLNREVAIKVLPASFANDADRLLRFEQEARATSALNHPNILTVYDIGSHEGSPYIVAELLEGEELRRQLSEGALPQRKAVDYAQQIASGLAAAHLKGIIHRDLKPENIFITTDGRVKILDFGLAKLKPAKQAAGASSELATQKALTDPGVVMGTVGYMSPEQVRGQEADHRSDIFSFGAILYEMLGGRRTFTGESAIEVMNAILKEEPEELTETNARINPALERIVRRCLEKKAERRFQSTSDLCFAIEALSMLSGSRIETAALPAVAEGRGKARLFGNAKLAWIVAGALLGLVVALLFILASSRRPAVDVNASRFVIPASEKETFTSLSVSPDGRSLVYGTSTEGKRRLWVRPLASLAAQLLPGTDKADPEAFPFWSPDSRYIAFFADGKLKKMEISGGPAQTLADAPLPRGGSWNRDGVIIFSPGQSPLYRVSEKGGGATQLTTLDESRQETSHRWPLFLPDGRHFLFSARTFETDDNVIYVGSLDSKEVKRVTRADSNMAYALPGYLLFARERILMAQPFDAEGLQVTGEAFPVVEHIRYNPGNTLAGFSASEGGVLIYQTGNRTPSQLTWFDRSGKKLDTVGPPGNYTQLRLSPDEKRVAVVRNDPPAMTDDIWLIELARGVESRLTSDPSREDFPVWSPDGSRIAFRSYRGRANLYQKLSSGAGEVEELIKSDENKTVMDWSADGRFILYRTHGGKTGMDIWVLPTFGDRKPYPLLNMEFGETWARFSPDGRWVAYVSNETGTQEVYVQEFQGSGSKVHVSTGRGNLPSWRRPDGKELFYTSDGKLMAVDVKVVGSSFEAGVPRLLFEIPRSGDFEMRRDGQQFLIPVPVEETSPTPITVWLNWTADLKR